jgi:hypothetical protein
MTCYLKEKRSGAALDRSYPDGGFLTGSPHMRNGLELNART